MKKVILSAAALMIGAVGFAQVTEAQVAQAVPTISGSTATANSGLSEQTGNDQRVFVQQVGEKNSSLTRQGNGSGSGNNKGMVLQYGPYDAPDDWSQNFTNVAELNQFGTRNEALVSQEFKSNNARIDQGLTDDSSRDNKAQVIQGDQLDNGTPWDANNDDSDLGSGRGNFANIAQDGNRNQATTNQRDNHNDALIDQDGNRNESLVKQNSTRLNEDDSDGHYARARQLGDDNASIVDQNGEYRSDAFSLQYGNNNEAHQIQDSHTSLSGSTATINQGSWDGDSSDFGEAFQTQMGGENVATINQTNGNAGNYNHAEQNQTGDGSDATITQNISSSAGVNYARQDQFQNDNVAVLDQEGSGNKAFQFQDGNGNNINSSQNGVSNSLNTYQHGDGSYGITMQVGNNNAALLVQHDGQSYTIDQNGSNNQANIFQGGVTGGALEACNFEDPMVFGGIQDVPALVIEDICVDCN